MKKLYYYSVKSVQVKNAILRRVATPGTVAVLSVVSELLNPFKMLDPKVYAAKIAVDAFKEAGQFSLMCGGIA